MDVDVLAVQEVENIDILKDFNRQHLNNLYPHRILIEGNDPRFIDVGLLSKLPVGAVSSFQTAVHPNRTDQTVFGRDLLEVEIYNDNRTRMLFTLYNNHLKSHFGDDDNGGQGRIDNDTRRQQQAEMIAAIVGQRMRSNSRYIITGDMNDPPNSGPLQPMLTIDGNPMFNALSDPTETRPPKTKPAAPTRLQRPGPTGTRSLDSLPSIICTTRYGSARRCKTRFNRQRSTAAPYTAATAATTIPLGWCWMYENGSI